MFAPGYFCEHPSANETSPSYTWKICATSVAPRNVPAFATNDTSTIRQPSRRNAGISLAMDNPANVSIGVVMPRKSFCALYADICDAQGHSGEVMNIATIDTQQTAGILRPVTV